MDEKLRNQALREYATLLRARAKADRETEARAENVARDAAAASQAASRAVSRAASRAASAAAHPFVTAFVAFMKAYPEGLKDQDVDELFVKYHDFAVLNPQRQPEDSSQLKRWLREFTPILRTRGWEVVERVSSRKIDESWKSVRLLEIIPVVAPVATVALAVALAPAAPVPVRRGTVTEVEEVEVEVADDVALVSTITPATDETETDPPRILSGPDEAEDEDEAGEAESEAEPEPDGHKEEFACQHHLAGAYPTQCTSLEMHQERSRDGDKRQSALNNICAQEAGVKYFAEVQKYVRTNLPPEFKDRLAARAERLQGLEYTLGVNWLENFIRYTFETHDAAQKYALSFEGDEELTATVDGLTVTIRLADTI
jgi:hypothetical protein